MQDEAMRLDHLSYACSAGELADVVQRLGSDLGAPFMDGGRHPRFGTRNFVLPLAGGSYLEVVSALDHPAVDKMPFGQAVRARAEQGGGWLGWVVSVEDITPFETRLGREGVAGHRIRPDGYELRWTQLGVLDQMSNPQLPFFVEWEVPASEHPSHGGRVEIESIEIAGDPQTVSDWLGNEDPLAGVDVRWVDSDEAGIVAVVFSTPNGAVRID